MEWFLHLPLTKMVPPPSSSDPGSAAAPGRSGHATPSARRPKLSGEVSGETEERPVYQAELLWEETHMEPRRPLGCRTIWSSKGPIFRFHGYLSGCNAELELLFFSTTWEAHLYWLKTWILPQVGLIELQDVFFVFWLSTKVHDLEQSKCSRFEAVQTARLEQLGHPEVPRERERESASELEMPAGYGLVTCPHRPQI